MLREQRLEFFEDFYIEATRYAKEIYKKDKEANTKDMTPAEKAKHYDKIGCRNSLKLGKECKGRSLFEQEDLGRPRKQRHPGYKQGIPEFNEENFSPILKRQLRKDAESGKTRTKKEIEARKEELKRSTKRRNEAVEKFNSYFKHSNHGPCNYKQKTPFP